MCIRDRVMTVNARFAWRNVPQRAGVSIDMQPCFFTTHVGMSTWCLRKRTRSVQTAVDQE
eukprot:7552927-Lingulodinium_polyedra.AAC.1